MKNLKSLLTFTLLIICLYGYSQIPSGYYTPAEGLSGDQLKTALHEIVKDHVVFPYTSSSTDTWDILKESDRDTANPDNVILFYSGWSVNAAQEYNNAQGWSREHVWAKSHGGFDTDDIPGTDVHALRPADISVNSARSNLDFDNGGTIYVDGDGVTECRKDGDSWEPRDAVKGDVARMLFYMATRYEGDNSEIELELADAVNTVNSYGINTGYHGKLSTLLEWHNSDPVDSFEINRNNVIYSYQGNRNPFIDHPEYVGKIWGITHSYIDITICQGEPEFAWNGLIITTEMDSIYQVTFTNLSDADSIVSLSVNVLPTVDTMIFDTIHPGDPEYVWNTHIVKNNMDSVYLDTFVSRFGCDSLVTLVVTVEESSGLTMVCPSNVVVECIGDLPQIDDLNDFIDVGGSVYSYPYAISAFTSYDSSDGNKCPEIVLRTYSITNSRGDAATCSQVIRVEDITAPTLILPDKHIYSSETWQVYSSVSDVLRFKTTHGNDAFDNCGTGNLSQIALYNQTIIVSDSTILERVYRIYDRCGNWSETTEYIYVNDSTGYTTDISENKPSNESLTVYPNPASDHLYIEYSGTETAKCSLYSMSGERIKRFTIRGKYKLNTQDLRSGIYLLQADTGVLVFNKQVVIRR